MARWDKPGVPHKGWSCQSVIDIADNDPDAPLSQCEMCGNERVRFVHIMSHPEYQGTLAVGCVCAEKMSGDYTGPRERENNLRNRAQRRARWLTRDWRLSSKGNEFLNVDGCNVVVFPNSRHTGKWSYGVDGEFSNNAYDTSDLAKLAAFDAMWEKTP